MNEQSWQDYLREGDELLLRTLEAQRKVFTEDYQREESLTAMAMDREKDS